MKDKKSVQIASRLKHKESLKVKRRKEPLLQRNEATRLEKPTILIVCEGQNTEPSYFRKFRLSSATIKPVGEGYNTVSLVNRAKELSEEKHYDQVWCVFDADPKPGNPNQAQNFNDAIKLATEAGFGIAYSNQAFEYWLILHFDDHQGGKMDRRDYNDKLNKHLRPYGLTYDGNGRKIISEDFFDLLDGIDEKTNQERKVLAICRAKGNYNLFDHKNIANEESSTTVFMLVEELLKYI